MDGAALRIAESPVAALAGEDGKAALRQILDKRGRGWAGSRGEMERGVVLPVQWAAIGLLGVICSRPLARICLHTLELI